MPSPEYFHRFGIFTKRAALPPALCDAARAAMQQAVEGPGTVWNPTQGENVALALKRRTEFVSLPADVDSALRTAIEGWRAEFEGFFGQPLARLQPLKFTRYDTGHYYGPHRDVSHDPEAPALLRDRRVSVVLFLNDQVDEPEEGCYCGGRLTFYELLKEPPFDQTGQPLDAEQGLLAAFRPDVIHEVTPITWGSRYSVVTWWE